MSRHLQIQQNNNRVLAETDSRIVLFQPAEGRIRLQAKVKPKPPPDYYCLSCGAASRQYDDDFGEGNMKASNHHSQTTTTTLSKDYFRVLDDWLDASSFNQGYYG
jgi:hypothetical protein